MLKYGVGKCFPSVQSFAAGYTPASMFTSGLQGAWYDPSDMSTLFQDSGGTSPVTAMEQPVGLMLDKSGRGNHAIQPTAINRPVLSARVNLLTKTEDFTQSWLADPGGSPASNAAIAPNGTMTASIVTVTTANALRQTIPKLSVDILYTGSVWIKRLTGVNDIKIRFVINDTVIAASVVFPVLPLNVWVFVKTTSQSGPTLNLRFDIVSSNPGSYAVWGSQLEPGSMPTRYQRVNTATDYDTVGFAKYLAFNGVNSCMSVPNIDLSVTNKLTIIAGLRKLVDTPDAIFLESSFSSTALANTGSFYVTAPEGAGGAYKVSIHGNNASVTGEGIGVTGYFAPISNVLSTTLDLSVASPGKVSLRVNALNPATTSFGTDGGNGSFQKYPLFIGSRANGSPFFNGNLYGLVVNGALLNTAQIAAAEKYINSKTGAY